MGARARSHALKRRLLFAVPFVVTCTKPAPRVPEPDEEEDASAVATRDASREPDAERVYPMPGELVAELEPLSRDMTAEDVCRRPGVRCNPPPPWTKRKPDPVGPTIRRVSRMQREGTGTRVRISRSGPMDKAWTATFVTNADNPTALPEGACTLGEHDYREIECVTALPPERLVYEGQVRPVRLVPPQSLVDRIERERAMWIDGMRGRIIAVNVQGADTVVVIAAGTNQNIDRTWTVTLEGQPADKAACVVLRVTDRTTYCKTPLPPDAVKAQPYVKFRPPD